MQKIAVKPGNQGILKLKPGIKALHVYNVILAAPSRQEIGEGRSRSELFGEPIPLYGGIHVWLEESKVESYSLKSSRVSEGGMEIHTIDKRYYVSLEEKGNIDCLLQKGKNKEII